MSDLIGHENSRPARAPNPSPARGQVLDVIQDPARGGVISAIGPPIAHKAKDQAKAKDKVQVQATSPRAAQRLT